MKMKFSVGKYLKCLVGSDDTWYNEIDGKEVEFTPDSSIGRCNGYFILKQWCEPINKSDN